MNTPPPLPPRSSEPGVSFVGFAPYTPEGYRDRYPLHRDNVVTCSWDEFSAAIQHAPGGKEEWAMLPVYVDWQSQHRDEQGCLRRMAPVVDGASAFVVLDSDGLTESEGQRVWDHIEALQLDAVAWSSWSHGSPDKPGCRFRLAIRLDREQTTQEITLVRKGLAASFARELGLPVERIFDRAAMDAARLFYAPTVAPERAHLAFVWRSAGGRALQVDDLVSVVPVRIRTAEARFSAERRKRIELGLEGSDMHEATDAHREAAQRHLDAFCGRLEQHGKLDGLGFELEYRTKIFGQYIEAGALDFDATVGKVEKALRTLGGDDCWLEGNVSRVRDRGLIRGMNEGPALPATSDRDALAIEKAGDEAGGLAGGAAEVQATLIERTPERSYSLVEAGVLVREGIERGLRGGTPVLLQVSTGAGKSHVAAQVMSERAREGLATVYLTQEHHVLAEVRGKLDAGVSSVHLASPLRSDISTGAPTCILPDEQRKKKLTLVGQGYSRASVCSKCERNAECPAFRSVRTKGDVVFATFVDTSRALREAPADAAIIVDEQPQLHEKLTITRERLEQIRDVEGPVWSDFSRVQKYVAKKLAHAWLTGTEPEAVLLHGEEVDPRELARKWDSQLEVPQSASKPSWAPASRHESFRKAVRSLLRVAARVEAPEIQEAGITALVLTDLGQALHDRARGRVVLSATPVSEAFPAEEWERVDVAVRDALGINVFRALYYAARVGRRALMPGGIPERDAVQRVIRRVLADHPTGSVLLTMYKPIADKLRAEWASMLEGRDVVLAHYGAIRGKNTIDGRAVMDFDNYVTVGDPYTGGVDELAADAGLVEGDDREDVWNAHTEAELGQAHGRARDVRRTKPAKHAHYGVRTPAGWHAGQGVDVVVGDSRVHAEADRKAAWSALEHAVKLRGAKSVAESLGVSIDTVKNWTKRQNPPADRIAELRALMPVDVFEWLGAYRALATRERNAYRGRFLRNQNRRLAA